MENCNKWFNERVDSGYEISSSAHDDFEAGWKAAGEHLSEMIEEEAGELGSMNDVQIFIYKEINK